MLKRPIAIAGMVLFACGQRPVEDETLVDTSRAVTLRSPTVSPAEHCRVRTCNQASQR
jgi:hypothetical protein